MNKTAILLATLLLVSLSSYISIERVQATYQGYSDMRTFDFNDLASSLRVQGTAYIYEDINYGGSSKYFSTIDVPSLNAYGWNDKISSLTVDGSITLYEHDNYGGRTVTFVNTPDPNENLGYSWGTNPSLVKSQGAWDSRVWGWDTSALELLGPDTDNYVNWPSDGLVSSQCKDSLSRPRWGACNFDQGYSKDQRYIPNLQACNGMFGDYIGSLKLQGTVTLYENANYGGASTTIGPCTGLQGWIPDLAAYGWNRPTRSLHLYDGGTLSVYSMTNYYLGHNAGQLITFATPSYQPNPLYIADMQTITLEGVVHDWYSDTVYTPQSWTGVKFDVWAVENLTSGKKIMMELYFLRTGGNLAWNPEWAKPPSGDFYNYLIAIDAFPQFCQRTIHPGNLVRWKIDVKGCLTRGAQAYGLDINCFSIAQISFTVESAVNVSPETPACGCKLSKLRLGYTLTSSLKYHWGMVSGDTNGDGKIDLSDLVRVSNAYGSVPGSANWNQMADLNLDGKVDLQDLTMVSSAYGSYAKVKQDYQTTLYLIIPGNPPTIITIAVITAKLFIMNNNKFFASVSISQYTTTNQATTSFLVGYEGYAISGAQDGQAGSFQYGEGNVGGAFGNPSSQWFARRYNYTLTTPLAGNTYRFETWGNLTGSYTYTSLRQLCTGYDMVQDFKDIHY